MKKSFTKQIVLFVICIVFLIVVIDLAIVLYRNNNDVAKNYNDNTSAINIEFVQDNKVIVTNKLPLTDIVGKKLQYDAESENQSYLDFNIISDSNEQVNYEIYIEKLEVDNEIDSHYVKIYLTDDKDEPYEGFDSNASPTYFDLRVSNIKPSARKLYSGVLDEGKTQKFRVRVWVSDSYVVKKDVESFSFEIKVKEN